MLTQVAQPTTFCPNLQLSKPAPASPQFQERLSVDSNTDVIPQLLFSEFHGITKLLLSHPPTICLLYPIQGCLLGTLLANKTTDYLLDERVGPKNMDP